MEKKIDHISDDILSTSTTIANTRHSNEYVMSNKYEQIHRDVKVLEYVGENMFIDDRGRKYVYENGKLYELNQITGERSNEEV
jgi:hypothetical protein